MLLLALPVALADGHEVCEALLPDALVEVLLLGFAAPEEIVRNDERYVRDALVDNLVADFNALVLAGDGLLDAVAARIAFRSALLGSR